MDKALGPIMIGLIIGIIVSLPILLLVFARKAKEQEFIENHRRIHPGMEKSQVICILGDNYTQSYLKNDIEKLEWRFRNPGYTSRVAKGVYVHSGSVTRRISVKFKNNRVIEVHSLNME